MQTELKSLRMKIKIFGGIVISLLLILLSRGMYLEWQLMNIPTNCHNSATAPSQSSDQ